MPVGCLELKTQMGVHHHTNGTVKGNVGGKASSPQAESFGGLGLIATGAAHQRWLRPSDVIQNLGRNSVEFMLKTPQTTWWLGTDQLNSSQQSRESEKPDQPAQLGNHDRQSKANHKKDQNTAEGREGSNTHGLNRKPRSRPVFLTWIWEMVQA